MHALNVSRLCACMFFEHETNTSGVYSLSSSET